MNRIIIISLLTCLAISIQAQPIKLSSDIWPPFTNEIGEPAFAMMLVHEALSRANRSATTTIEEFNDVLDGIVTGTYDGSAALWRTDDREEYLLYSAPYLENRLILVGPAGSDVSASQMQDLTGKKVAVVKGYAYGAEVERSGLELIKTGSDQESLDKVLGGEADYLLVDDLLMNYLMEHQAEDVSENLAVGKTTLFKRSLHFAVRKDLEGAEDIILDFDNEIVDMVKDGTYNKILQINWLETDVDGDGIAELVLGGTAAGTQAPVSSYSIMSQSQEVSPLADNDRYYIDGKIYDGWRNVPSEYKKKPAAPPVQGGFGPKLQF